MSGLLHTQFDAETTLGAAEYLKAVVSSAASGAGDYGRALDDPAARNLHRYSTFLCTPLAQRDDLETFGGRSLYCEQVGNSSADKSLAPSSRPRPQQLPVTFPHGQPQHSDDLKITAVSDSAQSQKPRPNFEVTLGRPLAIRAEAFRASCQPISLRNGLTLCVIKNVKLMISYARNETSYSQYITSVRQRKMICFLAAKRTQTKVIALFIKTKST